MAGFTRRTVLIAGVLVAASPALAQAPAPVVAAASDLQFALPEIAEAFRRQTGASVRLAFGSSGNLARQIRQEAPFELYLSADERYVLDLARDGFTVDEGVLYTTGRLALIVPEGSPLAPDGSLADLRLALEDGRLGKFAIANPEHAPYGRAARQALERAGLWESIRPHLVLGENVSQAAQFAMTGAAQGGLIAASLAVSPQLASRGSFDLVPAEMHEPLKQRMVLTRTAGKTARAFYDFLQGPQARALLERHGFSRPDSGD